MQSGETGPEAPRPLDNLNHLDTMTTKRYAFTDIVSRVSLEDLTEALLAQDPKALGTLMAKVPFLPQS
jgi:hypothetical protein